MELQASCQCSSQNVNFSNISQIFSKNTNWTFPVMSYLTWKLEFIMVSGNIWSFASNLLQLSLNLICLRNLVTLRPSTYFQPKLKSVNLQEKTETCPTWRLLFDLSTKVQSWCRKCFHFGLERFVPQLN